MSHDETDIMNNSAEGTAMSEASYLDTHYEAAKEAYEESARYVGFQKGWSILDAGAGGGSFIPLISDMLGANGKITALDLDAENVATIERRHAANEFSCPVEAHAGLVPRLSTWTGGLRAVGKTLEEAKWIFEQIQSFEEAGAWAVEVEVVPAQLLAEISSRTRLVTSSIGAGSGGDIQFMFAEDILGNHAPPYPRHTKQYRNLYKMEQAMQVERVEGFREYIGDVKTGQFPGPKHIVNAPEGLIDQFLSAVDGEQDL